MTTHPSTTHPPPSQPSPSPSRAASGLETVGERRRGEEAAAAPRRLLLLLGALGPPTFFLAAALTRRLNFDEPLALRAGWLLLSGIPAEPDFYMPTTLALGALAHAVHDPGWVFTIARGLAAGSVLGAGLWALHRTRLPAGVATGAAVLCLGQAAFATHAYEFRYDWAILVGWLLAFGALLGRSRSDLVLTGAVVGWLAAHHLKGVFFAGALYAIAIGVVIASRDTNGAPRSRLVALHLGLAASVAIWVGLSAALGYADEIPRLFRFFAGVAVESQRVDVWTALWPSWQRDLPWWGLASVATAATGVALARPTPAPDSWHGRHRAPVVLAVVFAFPPLLFLFAHPYPWPYMLALPAPFLALVSAAWMATVWHTGGWRRTALAGLVSTTVVLYGVTAGIWPGSPYGLALHSPNTAQVESLRLLQTLAEPDEKIIDPSGLAYFQPPCTSQWYLDTLLAARAERGEWMAQLDPRRAAECPWILNTYRFRMLPGDTRDAIAQQYRFGTGGLVLARDDARLQQPGRWPHLSHQELFTYWW